MGLFRSLKRERSGVCCTVLVLAAGSSSRMGEDKIRMQLGDLPVIVHTLSAFETMDEVNEVIVVTREDLISEIAALCKVFDLKKVSKVIRGGNSRLESARLGTLEVGKEATLIAIHDAARPFATKELISGVIDRAAKTGAAAPAVPVKDTIKIARDGLVESTPDRSALFAIQTPQVFDADLIRAALQKALDDGAEVTDDCSAVERLGMKVSLTQGDERNIKLTTPMDMAIAEQILQEGGL